MVLCNHLVYVGSDEVVQFVENSIDDFHQKMSFLVLWNWNEIQCPVVKWDVPFEDGALTQSGGHE